MEAVTEKVGGLVRVRATIHLAGLPVGAPALVDPDDTYIAACLERGYLTREAEGETAGAAAE